MSSLAPVDKQTTFIDVVGKKTQLTHGGSGPPLMYLHSAGGETEWTDFHELLAQRFTVYVPAHPGFSLSEGLGEIDDIQDLAWHYVDLLAALELGPVPIVGFSLGAWIGLELAVLRPKLVSRMVLAAAAGLYVPGAPVAEIFIDDLQRLRKLLFHDPNTPIAEQLIPSSMEDDRVLNWLRAREATARVAWNPYLHNPNLRKHLRRIERPALLLWGRQDQLIPLAHGEAYVELLPQAQLEVYEDCGHMLPFEQTERFVANCLGFL